MVKEKAYLLPIVIAFIVGLTLLIDSVPFFGSSEKGILFLILIVIIFESILLAVTS